jgi:hypothetical protein
MERVISMGVCVHAEMELSSSPVAIQLLSERQHTKQIAVALGVRGHLPKVDEDTLARYYRYLAANVPCPFTAWYPEPANAREERDCRCTVLELIDPAIGRGDPFDGILCKVRKGGCEVNLPLIELELPPDSPAYHLVEHFWYWFWHWR